MGGLITATNTLRRVSYVVCGFFVCVWSGGFVLFPIRSLFLPTSFAIHDEMND